MTNLSNESRVIKFVMVIGLIFAFWIPFTESLYRATKLAWKCFYLRHNLKYMYGEYFEYWRQVLGKTK